MRGNIQGIELGIQNAPRQFSKILNILILHFIIITLSVSPALAGEGTIGVLITGDIKYYRDIHNGFISKLNREGYADKVKVIVQTPNPDPVSLSNAVRKLIAVDVDVIVAYGASATVAAMREKTKIPIVYSGVYEPFASKIKAGNITGVNTRLSLSSLLRYLRGTTSITTLGIIYSSKEDESVQQANELYKLSTQYGFKVEAINLQSRHDVKTMLINRRLDAIFVTSSCIANMASSELTDFSRSRRIPIASLMPNNSFIVTLYAGQKDIGEKTAEKVIKIFDGVSLDKIGRSSSNSTMLIFNLKEAVSMGLNIPAELVTEATELIK